MLMFIFIRIMPMISMFEIKELLPWSPRARVVRTQRKAR
jgi:hypothetical protein